MFWIFLQPKNPMPIRGHKTSTAAAATAAIATSKTPSASKKPMPAPTTNGPTNPSSSQTQKSNVKANIAKSLEYKNHGNECVKKGDYRKGAAFYTEAIRLNKFDPVFLSNRALCNLKLEKYHECIEDCTIAIQLDSKSVKAYYRRMLAYEQLKINLDEALSDCEKILELEPKNADALRSLDRIKKLISASKSQEKDIEFKTEEDLSKSEFTIKATASTKLQKPKSPPTPVAPWPIDLNENKEFKEVEFVHKAPHLRSKEPLKRMSIDEVLEFSSVETKLARNVQSQQPASPEKVIPKTAGEEELNALKEPVDTDHNENVATVPAVPKNFLKPKTTTHFYRAWSTYQHNIQRTKILEVSLMHSNTVCPVFTNNIRLYVYVFLLSFQSIYNKDIAKLLGSQFDVNILNDILTILKEVFVKENKPIVNILKGILQHREMSIIAILMSDEDKLGGFVNFNENKTKNNK